VSILDTPGGDAKREILAQCAASTKVAAKVFYPGRFRLPFSPSHDKVFQALDDDSIQLLVIASWRGFGKTSMVQLAYPTKRAIFQDSKFIIPVSASFKQSVMQSENLKHQLKHNRRLHDLGFKNLQSDVWSRDMWVMNTIDKYGCMYIPTSYGQQVRGLLYKDERPDLYIIDDYEDSESVLSEEMRQKKIERFYSDIMGSIDRNSKKWRIIVIGTVLHEDSLLMRLLEDPHWHSIHLELCDDEYESNWPEQQTSAEVRDMANRYRAQGLMDVFFREYRNICMSPEGAPFRSSLFKYYTPNMLKDRFLEYFVLVDPAKTVTQSACDTAIVGVGLDMLNGEAFIIDMVCSRLHVHEQIDEGLNMCQRIGAKVIGVEVAGSGEYIEHPWKSAILERGLGIEFVSLAAKGGPSQYIPKGSTQHGKDARISAALVPMYNQGKIWHLRDHPLNDTLEEQLVHYPRAKRKDLIDALSYITGMMHKGDRYFANQTVKRNYASGKILMPGGLDFHAEEMALKKLTASDMGDIPGWRV